MDTTFAIEKNIPVPSTTRTGSGTPYPFAAMNAGDSFKVPVPAAPDTITDAAERDKMFSENARTVANRMGGACRRFSKSNAGYTFAVRVMKAEGAVRVWCTAAPVAPPAAPPAPPAPTKNAPAAKAK